MIGVDLHFEDKRSYFLRRLGGYVLVYFGLIQLSFAQSLPQTAPTQYNNLIDRFAILSDSIHSHSFPYSRNLKDYLLSSGSGSPLGPGDEQSQYLLNSFNKLTKLPISSKSPILNHFYRTPAHMLEVNRPEFTLRVNPILNLKYGQGSLDDEKYFQNTRGIEIRGSINNKVHFYSNILENQGRFGEYVDRYFERTNALPGEGLVKTGNQSSTNRNGNYDWLDATGYIQFNAAKAIDITFGHTKNFIGNGYRSLVLSDFADNYLQLRLDTRIGKFHYQNIFAEISRESRGDVAGDQLLGKKYFTAHTLSYNPSDKFNIYLFETVVFGRTEGFEMQYLNPLIFYRAVEGGLGSPDNVLLGLGSKWDIANQFQVYGQFMLDEFRFEEIKAGNGWWANKFALQLGAKWINALGIKNLDGQIEYNQARPYIYSHRDSLSSYAHYNQPLAHPLGANFRELILKGRYNINYRWFFEATLMYANVGEDSDDTNFGNNILVSHNTRSSEYGNSILQGVRSDIVLGKLDISYMLRHNLFIDLSLIYRDQQSDDPTRNYNSTIINGGIRMNIRKRDHIF